GLSAGRAAIGQASSPSSVRGTCQSTPAAKIHAPFSWVGESIPSSGWILKETEYGEENSRGCVSYLCHRFCPCVCLGITAKVTTSHQALPMRATHDLTGTFFHACRKISASLEDAESALPPHTVDPLNFGCCE